MAHTRTRRKKKRRPGLGLWALFWFFLIGITVYSLVEINWDGIKNSIVSSIRDSSDTASIAIQSQPKNIRRRPQQSFRQNNTSAPIPKRSQSKHSPQTKAMQQKTPIKKQQHKKPFHTVKKTTSTASAKNTRPHTAAPSQKTVSQHPTPSASLPVRQTKTITIYFTHYNSELDKIAVIPVPRKIPASDSPLSTAINTLLAGPSAAEQNRNIESQIPGGVVLKSASVKNGIAYLDFNGNIEAFPGTSTCLARLYQIVYTATEFSTVNGVRILINGSQKKSFSAENIDISSPLYRIAAPVF